VLTYDLCNRSGDFDKRIVAKLCKSLTPSEVENEYRCQASFHANCSNSKVAPAKPLGVEAERKVIVMEYLEGETLGKTLLSVESPHNPGINRSVDLAALALSTFHRVSELSDREGRLAPSPYLRPDIDLEHIYRDLDKCGLQKKAKSFLDFSAMNIQVASDCDTRVALLDLPYVDCVSTPHLDLARFKFSLEVILQHPQYKLLRLNRWNPDSVFRRMLDKYSDFVGAKPNEHDMRLIEIMEGEYARKMQMIYSSGRGNLRLLVEGTYLKNFLQSLSARELSIEGI